MAKDSAIATAEPTQEDPQNTLAPDEVIPQATAPAEPATAPAPVEGVAPEDLNKIVAAARQEEKDKLYPTIDKLKEEKKTYKQTIKGLEEKLADVQKQNSKAAPVGELEEQAHQVHELMETVSMLTVELQSQKDASEASLVQMRLATVQKDIIAQSGGKIIPEMVVGNSEAELLESAELAKARYIEIFSQGAGAAGQSAAAAEDAVRQQVKAALPATPEPASAPATSTSPTSAEDIDWDQVRQEVANLPPEEQRAAIDKLKKKALAVAGQKPSQSPVTRGS